MANFTDKQQAFINEYLKCFNATEAAKRAGYSEKSARQMGSENLSKPYIAEEISLRVAEMTMKADEALLRLSRMARASFADLAENKGGLPFIDWRKAFETGAIDMVKEITYKNDGSMTVKLHDAQSALVSVIKQLQLNGGGPTERTEYTIVYPED